MQAAPFPAGVAIQRSQITAAAARGLIIAAHFPPITEEFGMKPDITAANPGGFDWLRADALAGRAKAHGSAVRGHALFSHPTTPAWLLAGSRKDIGRPRRRCRRIANGAPLARSISEHRSDKRQYFIRDLSDLPASQSND